MNRSQRRKRIKEIAKEMAKVKGENNVQVSNKSDYEFLVKRYKNELKKGKR